MFSQLGAPEILLILLVVVLLFGAKKLPDLARGAGQGLRIFKDEVKADEKPDAIEGRVLDEAVEPAAEKKPEQQG